MTELQAGFQVSPLPFEDEAGTDEILVTGGSGLIGSHLIELLINQKKKVRALFRTTKPSFAGSQYLNWVKGDILDVISLQHALLGVKQVYHCAGLVSFSSKQKDALFAINVEGTANVVNEALNAGVDKLCYVSSVAAIGKQKTGSVINEQTPWKTAGNGYYALSKHYAEVEVWRAIGEGLKAVIVNPSIVLGSGDFTRSSGKLFTTAFNEFPFYTTGINGFVDVNDLVVCMTELMHADIEAERFIVSGANLGYRQLLELMAAAFGKHPPKFVVGKLLSAAVVALEALKGAFSGVEPLITPESRQSAISQVFYDNSKLLQALPGFTFTPIESTVQRVCSEFLRENAVKKENA